MNMLKPLPSIFWYFVTWQRIQLWLAALGALFILLSVLIALRLVFSGADSRIYGSTFLFLFLGLGCIFLFPVLTAGLAYRSLVTRRQYMVAPLSGQSALLVLLLFTLLAALLPYSTYLLTSALMESRGEFPFINVLMIFNFVSIFHYLCQSRMPGSGKWSFNILPWLIIILLMNLPETTVAPLFQPIVTVLVFLLVAYGWIMAFRRINHPRALKAGASNIAIFAFQDGPESVPNNARVLTLDLSATHSVLPEKSLYYGISTSTRSRILSVAFRVYLLPLLFSLLWALMFYLDEKSLPEKFFPVIYLALAGLLAILTSLTHGELIKRSKLLWLRTGGQRSALWHLFDRIILEDLFMTGMAIGILALTALASGYLSLAQAASYLFSIIAISLYFTWLGVFCSMRKGLSASPTFLLGLVVAAALLIERVFGNPEVNQDVYLRLAPVSLFLLVAGFIFRQLAAHTFTGIDWLQIKPALFKARGRS